MPQGSREIPGWGTPSQRQGRNGKRKLWAEGLGGSEMARMHINNFSFFFKDYCMCLYVCTYVHVCVCVCMSMCMCASMCVCMHAHVYVDVCLSM